MPPIVTPEINEELDGELSLNEKSIISLGIIKKMKDLVTQIFSESKENIKAYHDFVCHHEAGHLLIKLITESELRGVTIKKLSFDRVNKLSDLKRARGKKASVNVGTCLIPSVRIDYGESGDKLLFLLAISGIAATLDHKGFEGFQKNGLSNTEWTDISESYNYLIPFVHDQYPDKRVPHAVLEPALLKAARLILDTLREAGGETILLAIKNGLIKQSKTEKDTDSIFNSIYKDLNFGYHEKFALRKKLLAIDFSQAFK